MSAVAMRASLIVILAALLAGAGGCSSIPYTPISPTASPSVGPPRKLLTFERFNAYMRMGHELVLFDDGRLEHTVFFQGKIRRRPEGPIAPAAMAKVRASVLRLSGLRPDCCNCAGAFDESTVVTTFLEAGRTEVTTFEHYLGCGKTPDWLYDVENDIAEALGAKRWERELFGADRSTRIDRQP